MSKTNEQNQPLKGLKDTKLKKGKQEKQVKVAKEKNGDALVGRVKKVIKKSRRKMGEEKFERQLQRTIAFLEELQLKLNQAPAEKASRREKKNAGDNGHAAPKARSKAKSKSKSNASSVSPIAAQSGKVSANK